MSLAENLTSKPNGLGGAASTFPWPTRETFERLARSPSAVLPGRGGRRMVVHVDRVRAQPALSPSLAMNLGVGAIGLGLWGALFPRHVKKTLGIRAPEPVVQAVFGVRELVTGFTLAGDPTKAAMLWARVGGDVFDILALRALDRPANPKRGTARAALGLVLAITALDVVTAVRMSNVKRNCL